jgi:hypothetical protein
MSGSNTVDLYRNVVQSSSFGIRFREEEFVGLLLFIFFVVPYFGLAGWVWWETVGLQGARRVLLGTNGPGAGRSGSPL